MPFLLPSALAGCPADTRVLLGLSGGADSTALLDLLVHAGVPVSAAHVNHCIRGADADRDEEFCRGLAEQYGIPLFVCRADVPAEAAAAGEGLEEAARRVRYDFFRRVMEEHDIPLLATAHNADDNLETLLFHIVRGSGARGGCGIPPVRPLGGGGLAVRPILTMTKAEVLGYCRAHGLSFVTDETNTDLSYSRNRLRANVLPELRRINPDAAGAALRFCEALREDSARLDAEAGEHLARFGTDTAALRSAPRAVAARAVMRAASDAGASPERAHVDALLSLPEGGSVTLPGSVLARSEGGRLTFARDERKKPVRGDAAYPPPAELPLAEGENTLPGCPGTVIFCPPGKSCRGIYNLSIIISLNVDTIKGELRIRTRRPGDTIRLGGRTKSVRKLLCDAHTPLSAEERRALPVVCDDDGIVWVPFLPARDGCNSSAGDAPASLGYLPPESL